MKIPGSHPVASLLGKIMAADKFGFKSWNAVPWHTFEDILLRLHAEGIYIHADQLAEFYLAHGLPVDLSCVPDQLQEKARRINANYQGDMAHLEEIPQQPL